jgi:hypothetical protein
MYKKFRNQEAYQALRPGRVMQFCANRICFSSSRTG